VTISFSDFQGTYMLLKKNEKKTPETTSPFGLLESLLSRMFG
jgi:hypothetical protein